MRRVAMLVAILAVLAGTVGAGAAGAQPAVVAIDGRTPALVEREGGGWTAKLGFTNLTDAEISLAVVAADKTDLGCAPSPSPDALATAERTAVTVTIPAGCDVGDDGIALVATTDASSQTFEIAAAPKPSPDPDWDELLAFPIALGLALLIVAALTQRWAAGERGRGLGTPLPLDANWSYTGSWATNVTGVGGILTAFFATSGAIKALLGADAESAVALATVGSAIAVGAAAAAPVLLLATKTKDTNKITAGGLLAAATVTLAAAGGLLWVGYRTGTSLDLGGVEDWLFPALFGAAGVLLIVYAFRSLRFMLEDGTRSPETLMLLAESPTPPRSALL